MARLEIETGRTETPLLIAVTLSARNALALLSKLEPDMDGSARTIGIGDVYIDGEQVDKLVCLLRIEPDDEHYGRRGFPPGPMHPRTEAYVAAHGGIPGAIAALERIAVVVDRATGGDG